MFAKFKLLRTQVPGVCQLRSTVAAAANPATARPTKSRAEFFRKDPRPIILFDGVCNFCNQGVDFVLRWDRNQVFRLGALQSETGRTLLEACGRNPEDLSSMVVVESDAFYVKSDAALEIAKRLQIPLPLAYALISPVPQSVRDGWYDFVADNRYKWMGTRETCRVPSKGDADRFV